MVRGESLLRPFLQRQDGVVTTAQALSAGVTERQLRALIRAGWTQPARGVYVSPHPVDAFRASVRAALLACPDGAACEMTAARLQELWGLAPWTPSEVPQLLVPGDARRPQRAGMRLHYGLEPHLVQMRQGMRLTRLARTVRDLAARLGPDELVCLLDSALRLGWKPDDYPLSRSRAARVSAALILTDSRSESPLETRARLVLTRAGLPPELLQLNVFDRDCRWIARVDMAWIGRRVVIEVDGLEYHETPEAVLRDRDKQNRLAGAGWTLLRFTWFDIVRQPEYVIARVRAALACAA
jgi:hypothetical protein